MTRENIFEHKSKITYQQRVKRSGHEGMVLWLTGLSGAGKSTIAFSLEYELTQMGYMVYCLDGDNLRAGINENLGFTVDDRYENVRRIAHIARLFQEVGFIVIVACISPLRQMRSNARKIIGERNFIEVYIKANVNICRARDPKGLYKKVQKDNIDNFTGVSAKYEEPLASEILIDTTIMEVNESVQILLNGIERIMTERNDKCESLRRIGE